MWTYIQSSGQLFDPSSNLLSIGYSGAVGYKNQSMYQDIIDKGPIPCGYYTLGDIEPSTEHGPDAIPLIPDADNIMFGRAGFWMHGDNIHQPGTASEGCIIQPKFARDIVGSSTDRRLQVVKELTVSA